MDEAFEELFGAPDSDGIRLVQLRELTEIEERAAACMEDLGFRYVPVSYESVDELAREREEDPEGFVAEYGYGIVERATRGFDESPNAAYVEALSQAERDAFVEALVGDLEGFGAGSGSEYDPSATATQHSSYVLFVAQSDGGGCLGEAIGAASYLNRTLSLGNTFEATQEALEADARYQALLAEWRSCMSDQGFSFNEPVDAENAVLVRIGPLLSSAEGDVAAVEDELVEIAGLERAVATADMGCGRREIDEVYALVTREAIIDVARERGELSGDR